MNKNSRYGYRVLGNGVYVSNDTRITKGNNNDLVVGASGSSKTGSLVYSQLKSLKDSSLIVADSKGQLCRMFTDELKQKGYEVLTLDFVNPHKSCKYNPLDYIRKDHRGRYREQDIAKLAAALIPLEIEQREPFWPMSARMYLEFFVAYALSALPKKDHNIYSVLRLYRAFIKKDGDTGFIPWLNENPDSFAKKRYDEMCGNNPADRTVASIYGFINSAIFPFDISEMRYIYDPYYNDSKYIKKTLDIASLGEKKTVLFLNVSDTDHSMDSLVNLFYTQALQTLIAKADESPGGQLKIPVRIILDDFASSAIIPDFDRILSVVRSRDIWLTICIQSFTQLESLYTYQQAQTIINNCDHIIYLGSNDIKSAEFIGTRARKTPESVLSMDRSMEYILEGGKPAMLVEKVPPYSYEDNEEVTFE
ncbi:VirD4-like conjugal transfer protein, CD1115 family [Butyrivibrio sp. NC2002]|uniref:VirD4-like conjugal transfer protein, CD1115 family n=1 Tax=Butyrivibrio sp. NC2002 TaxID=1410610 RepID=UPI0006908181|nr:type IV secretory system conjugative DNA transfer family protein [Butyrivibrio sp. NC2002]